jgi:ribulose-bisphosphate carboxylase large chain
MLLIGGSLIGHSPDLVANARHFLGIAGRKDTYGPLENKHHPASYPATATTPAVVPHAPAHHESNEEVTKLQKRCVQMEKNVAMLTEMYLNEEKARKELEKKAAAGSHHSSSKDDHHGDSGHGHHKPGTTLPPGVAAPATPVDGNYSKVFNRPKDGSWTWERIPQEMYKQDGGSFKGCSRFELLGKRGESTVFHVRYFEVDPGGWTTLEHHRHEHAVIGLRGEGEIQLGPHVYPVHVGDAAYTAPGDTHQLRNNGDEPFGFICVVAADRDRPVEVDPKEFLKSTSLKHALQHGVKESLEAQAKHRASMGGDAEPSACEWKPGMKKKKQAAEAVESGSACEWTPGKKR